MSIFYHDPYCEQYLGDARKVLAGGLAEAEIGEEEVE